MRKQNEKLQRNDCHHRRSRAGSVLRYQHLRLLRLQREDEAGLHQPDLRVIAMSREGGGGAGGCGCYIRAVSRYPGSVGKYMKGGGV